MIDRLSSREKGLLAIIGGAVFLIINFALISGVKGKFSANAAEAEALRTEIQGFEMLLEEKDLWQKRMEWIKEVQPPLQSESGAAVELLEAIKQQARSHEVLLENPVLGSLEDRPEARVVSVSVDTKSSWKNLVEFLVDLQQPDKFITLENVRLQIDSGDNTKLKGSFKIAKWFAPKE